MKKKQLIGIFLLLAVLGTALFLLLNHQTLAGTQQKILPLLTAQIFKVGKADAIVLQLEEKVIILDAGEEEDGREIAEYLKKRNLNRVDAMIITHFDKDHVGGADTVLEELEDRYDMKPILYVNHHVYGMYLADEAYADYPIWISDPDESDTLSDGSSGKQQEEKRHPGNTAQGRLGNELGQGGYPD